MNLWPFRKPSPSYCARTLNSHRRSTERETYKRTHDELAALVGKQIPWAR